MDKGLGLVIHILYYITMLRNILAIETSSAVCSVALSTNGVISEQFQPAQREQSQLILPMIDTLLIQAGLTLSELDVIALAIGPGSFTGVRLGLSVVQGLTISTEIPIIAISSLQALAQGIYHERADKKVIVCVNAYMDEIYSAQFQLAEQDIMMPLSDEQLLAPKALILPEDIAEWVGVGTGWGAYSDQLSVKPPIIYADYLPHATEVLDLAIKLYSPKRLQRIDEVEAMYLRTGNAWRHNTI